ncbi:DUF368 domain-containing protein [Spongiivirga sp. MCCC 1A20706]|uniref:DUF368 domain-containing protein n=1 Tax=Spongiivirga sp. MCCC 1A20706 TaxID=3160963 RepID=UPI003977AC5D
MSRSIGDYFVIGLKGLAMGAADVVPGVSGGTIAFISGIYEELLSSINNLDFSKLKELKKNGLKATWKSINGNFLFALFSGVAISIFSLAKGLEWLLHNKPILLWSFFFGLIVASAVYIAKQVKKWGVTVIIACIIGLVVSYLITVSEPLGNSDNNFYLFFCGAIAIIAMILPGISGSFILILLGAYEVALGTVNQLREGLLESDWDKFGNAFMKFIILALGAVVGLKLFSKALTWMFTKHKDVTLAILTGFMIGSLNKIWPWKETLSTRVNSKGEIVPLLQKSISPSSFEGEPKILLAIGLMVVGFLTIFILEKIANKPAE